MPNVTLKIFDGDIAPDSEAQTALNKYMERKNEA